MSTLHDFVYVGAYPFMYRFEVSQPDLVVAVQLTAIAALIFGAALYLHLAGPRSTPAAVLKAVLLVVGVLPLATYYGATAAEVRLTEQHLAFKVPGFYGRTVSWKNVDFDGVRIVDLEQDSELQPKLRTNGIGLYGLRVGWFKVNDGHTAWLAVTQTRRVVVVPQVHGPVDLVSVEDPDGLVAHLRRIGAALAEGDEAESSDGAEGDEAESSDGAEDDEAESSDGAEDDEPAPNQGAEADEPRVSDGLATVSPSAPSLSVPATE